MPASFDTFKEKLKDQKSPEHTKLVQHVRDLAELSRKEMSKQYSLWDQHDATFRSKRKKDKEDDAAVSRGQPKKMVVPLTFSQCMTFVAYNTMTLTQNKRFYGLEPTGTEDNPLREPMELILERDLRRNTWQAFLVQFFLDIARFSIGCAEVCYAEEYRWMRVEKTEVVEGAFGTSEEETSAAFQQIPTFVGNKIVPVSPYRILPDTRLPLTRFQEGEFCGSEDMWSFSSLQSDTNLFNTDEIPKFDKDAFGKRKTSSRIVEMDVREKGDTKSNEDMVKGGMVCITKMVCDIVPKHFKTDKEGKSVLGDEAFPVRYIVWLANDQTIVRFDEAYYLHGQFPYMLSQYIPDQHQTVNESLADTCEQIASLITWKWNAHITSTKNSVESKWIVDPAGIDVKSLESRSPYIHLKKNASQTGVDRYIKQFTTTDPTANIAQDSAALETLLEKLSGYSSFMQGQPSQGRRSATQDRATIQGAGMRGKTTLGAIWDTGFERLGKQLIANNRQEMDFETFERIVGGALPLNTSVPPIPNPMTGMPEAPRYTIEELYALFKADPVSIATSEDFFVFDGSNPSENAFLAQSLQEIWMTIVGNPEIAAVLGYGPTQLHSMLEDIYNLRGVTQSRLPKATPQAPVTGPVPPNVEQMPVPALPNASVS
jgi:hypothetical protein